MTDPLGLEPVSAPLQVSVFQPLQDVEQGTPKRSHVAVIYPLRPRLLKVVLHYLSPSCYSATVNSNETR